MKNQFQNKVQNAEHKLHRHITAISKALLFFVFCTLIYFPTFSQGVAINALGNPPNDKAILDIESTSSGLLVPRMTTAERNGIEAPIPESLLIYNTETQCFEAWNGINWVEFGCIGCELPGTFSATIATNITATSFNANWTASAGASTYYLDVNTNISFTGTAILNNHDVGNVTTYTVSSLTCGTTYYYRLRASNVCGTSVNSNIISLETGACGPSCGEQVFVAANLNAGTYMENAGSAQSAPYGHKYCYNNLASNCDTYGGLYQWTNVMLGAESKNCDPCTGSDATAIQGMCPSGYHIPTDLEWSRYEHCVETTFGTPGTTPLVTFQTTNDWRGDELLGPGKKMKSNAPISWMGTNTSGFNALPGGYLDGFILVGHPLTPKEIGSSAYFWSATKDINCWYRKLSSDNSKSFRGSFKSNYALSVRCIKN